MRLTHTETVIRRSSLIGVLNSQRAEATMKPGRIPSVSCPRLLASSTRAVSMYWRYVALLTCPITSMSLNWTGSSMLNFTFDSSLTDRRLPYRNRKDIAHHDKCDVQH